MNDASENLLERQTVGLGFLIGMVSDPNAMTTDRLDEVLEIQFLPPILLRDFLGSGAAGILPFRYTPFAMPPSTSLARWISILAHPFVMAVVLAVAAGLRAGDLRGGMGAAVAVGLVILPVALLMARQVRAGRWGNVDASEPRERPLLFAVALLALLALLVYLWLRRTDTSLLRGVAGTLALVVVAAVANRWIKVSLHMAFAALTVTVLVVMGSVVGWCLVPVLPALAWSRLRLARHRPVELVAGTALGLVAGLAVHWL